MSTRPDNLVIDRFGRRTLVPAQQSLSVGKQVQYLTLLFASLRSRQKALNAKLERLERDAWPMEWRLNVSQ